MKKLLLFLLMITMLLSVCLPVFAGGGYIGETRVTDNMLFINGNSAPAAQLPNEFVYLPVDVLEYFGFDVLSDNKEYTVTRNTSRHFVPEFTYTAEHFKDYTKVYTTNARVYIDSETPANVFELEDGTILVQCDELAKYGTFNWDADAGTISIDFIDVGLPVGQPFHNVLGLNAIEEISSGVIVRNDGKCADIEYEDLKEWLSVYWDFAPYDRVVAPYDSGVYREWYIKLCTKDKEKSFIVYPNGGVIVGSYGEPCESHGEVKNNYVWYLPYVGNGRNALYIADTKLGEKYIIESSENFKGTLRDVTTDDTEKFPGNNLLNISGASEWAVPEIQMAASCNLLPYELAGKYTKSITRQEFCTLIYRLIATEFSPYSDSRMGEWSAADNVIYERGLAEKVNSVKYSDCEDDKIKFLSGAGIIYGMGDGRFAPDEYLTREQAAAILYRTAEFLGNKTILKPGYTKMYDDEGEISDWALSAVASMKAMGIMKGVSDTEFEPLGSYTTEQAIVTMLRLYEN